MTDDKIARFWDNYIRKLEKFNIKPDNRRWYVRHAERYIKAHEGLRLQAHGREQVEAYLERQAQNPKIEDWQHRQII